MTYSPLQLQEKLNKLIGCYPYPLDVPGLYEPACYMMSLGGKRLRPSLLLMGRNVFTDELEDAYHYALGIEFFHNFTLMHDDIMDKAPLRRGQTSVHEKWNINTAILTGDAMMVEAYSLMCQGPSTNKFTILEIFNTMARQVCEGQHLDIEFETREVVHLSEYLEMIRLKTAVLLGTSLQIGALSAGADPITGRLLYDFGLDLGIAFQLQDDLLDVYGVEEKFGKLVGGDILANKKTWLLLNAVEIAGTHETREIASLMANEPAVSAQEKINRMTQVYNKLRIRENTEQAIAGYTKRAYNSLSQIEVAQERKVSLLDLLNSIGNRES